MKGNQRESSGNRNYPKKAGSALDLIKILLSQVEELQRPVCACLMAVF